jgi:hypothetical protein
LRASDQEVNDVQLIHQRHTVGVDHIGIARRVFEFVVLVDGASALVDTLRTVIRDLLLGAFPVAVLAFRDRREPYDGIDQAATSVLSPISVILTMVSGVIAFTISLSEISCPR